MFRDSNFVLQIFTLLILQHKYTFKGIQFYEYLKFYNNFTFL